MTEIPRPLLSAVSRFVAAHFGLHFPPTRWDELAKAIQTAAVEFGFTDPRACHAALTIAQDEASCVILGMPAEATHLNGAGAILALDQIAPALIATVNCAHRRADAESHRPNGVP